MSAGFTPGPWSTPHFAKPEVNCPCNYVLCDGYMGAVASVHCSGEGDDWQSHGDNPKFDEAVANAHLIAAAPELYEAVRLFVEVYDASDEADGVGMMLAYNSALEAGKAALAKARGE